MMQVEEDVYVRTEDLEKFRHQMTDVLIPSIQGVLLADGWHEADEFYLGVFSFVKIQSTAGRLWDYRYQTKDKESAYALSWLEGKGKKMTVPLRSVLAIQEHFEPRKTLAPTEAQGDTRVKDYALV